MIEMGLLFELKMRMRSNPQLFRWLYTPRESVSTLRRVVRPTDDMVIEGFPRSANTFASYAFKQSQPRPVLFGNHFHSPAQFLLAKQYGVPALLVIRDPLDAGISMALFAGNMSAKEVLLRYIAFHTPLLAIRDYYEIARFEETVSDFSKPMARLNERFGSNFALFEHSEENEQRVKAEINAVREAKAALLGERYRDPMRSTIPTPEKTAAKDEVRQQFLAHELADLRLRADEIYRSIVGE